VATLERKLSELDELDARLHENEREIGTNDGTSHGIGQLVSSGTMRKHEERVEDTKGAEEEVEMK
jgi:hypothetical protein